MIGSYEKYERIRFSFSTIQANKFQINVHIDLQSSKIQSRKNSEGENLEPQSLLSTSKLPINQEIKNVRKNY